MASNVMVYSRIFLEKPIASNTHIDFAGSEMYRYNMHIASYVVENSGGKNTVAILMKFSSSNLQNIKA